MRRHRAPSWTPLRGSGGQTQANLGKSGEDAPLGQPAGLALAFATPAADASRATSGRAYGVVGGAGDSWAEAG